MVFCLTRKIILFYFYKYLYGFSSLNFWDEAWWFLSFRVFGLLSSSLLLFPQCFSRWVLRPSSGVCRTRKLSWNFELRPLLNPQGLPVLIPLAITGYKCSLWIVQWHTWCNVYRHWFPKLLRRQSSGGCGFDPDCSRVTIQEYLILVPGNG